MSRRVCASVPRRAWIRMSCGAAVAVVLTTAIADAQVVGGAGRIQGRLIQRMQFGAGAWGGMRPPRPVDEGSALFPGDDFRRIGDPWWDDVGKEEAVAEPPKVEPPAAADVAQGEGTGDNPFPLDAATLSREQREAVFKETARLAAVTGMMCLRRELSTVRQIRPALDEQQRAFVLLAGRKAVRERLAALEEKPLTRWTNEQKQGQEAAIRAAIAASLGANDSDAAREAYEAEVAGRDDRRQRAAVAALVAEIDRDAPLTVEEKTRLADGLTEFYREAWRGAAEDYPGGLAGGLGMQLPSGLDRSVERVLGKQRKAEWLARRQAAGGDAERNDDAGMGIQNGRVLQIRGVQQANGVGVAVVVEAAAVGPVQEEAAKDPAAEGGAAEGGAE
jgi:hypothetical protein